MSVSHIPTAKVEQEDVSIPNHPEVDKKANEPEVDFANALDLSESEEEEELEDFIGDFLLHPEPENPSVDVRFSKFVSSQFYISRIYRHLVICHYTSSNSHRLSPPFICLRRSTTRKTRWLSAWISI